jgi:hypothetical protein
MQLRMSTVTTVFLLVMQWHELPELVANPPSAKHLVMHMDSCYCCLPYVCGALHRRLTKEVTKLASDLAQVHIHNTLQYTKQDCTALLLRVN